MIDYIKNEQLKTVIYKNNMCEYKNQSAQAFIKQLCHEKLFTYEGYKKATKIMLKYKYKIPLYIDEYLQLIPTKGYKEYDSIWINIAAIKTYDHDINGVKIRFNSGEILYLNISMKYIKNQIYRLNEIRNLLSKHFHF